MDLDRLHAAIETVSWLGNRAAELPDDPARGKQMHAHMVLAANYLAEYANQLRSGSEPYDALLSTARSVLELSPSRERISVKQFAGAAQPGRPNIVVFREMLPGLKQGAMRILGGMGAPDDALDDYSQAFDASAVEGAAPCPYCFVAGKRQPLLRIRPTDKSGGLACCQELGCRAEIRFRTP